MTICILKLERGQKIARPFSRASDLTEAAQILGNFEQLNTGPVATRCKRACDAALNATRAFFPGLAHVDTEQPVFTLGSTKFYAFRE